MCQTFTMSWINELWNSKQTLPPAKVVDDAFFYALGSVGAAIWGGSEHMADFLEVPELNAVISWKARAWSSMKLEVVYKQTDKEVSNSESLVRVLRQPNFFQSQKEFLMQTKIWQEVYGNEFIYKNTPAGMNTYKGLFTLNPSFVTIDYGTEQTPFYLASALPQNIRYKTSWSGKDEDITANVIHINSTNTNPQSGNWLIGGSSLTSLSAAIENIRASYEARNVIISNRGALGILSNGSVDGMGSTMPMNPKEKESVQNALKGYGLAKNQSQFILTNLNLKWQQMAVDADKLQLHEECNESFKTICHVLGVNYEIFDNGNTYENKRMAELATYQNTIIPEANEWVDALNRSFDTASKSWVIKCSFDHLPIFSENVKERAQSLVLLTNALSKAFTDGAITKEQYSNELSKFKVGI